MIGTFRIEPLLQQPRQVKLLFPGDRADSPHLPRRRITERAIGALRAVPVLTVAALGALMALTVRDMVLLHPYQYVYFNRAVIGGLPGAAKRFDTDYWGASYKEGVRWLVDQAPDPPSARRLKVASCSHSESTSYFLPADRFDYVGSYHGLLH